MVRNDARLSNRYDARISSTDEYGNSIPLRAASANFSSGSNVQMQLTLGQSGDEVTHATHREIPPRSNNARRAKHTPTPHPHTHPCRHLDTATTHRSRPHSRARLDPERVDRSR